MGRKQRVIPIIAVIMISVPILFLSNDIHYTLAFSKAKVTDENNSILVFYNKDDDLQLIQDVTINSSMDFIYQNIYNITGNPVLNESVSNITGVLFISKDPFIDEIYTNVSYSSFLNSQIDQEKPTIIFTPFLNNFSDSYLTTWGIIEDFSLFEIKENESSIYVSPTEFANQSLGLDSHRNSSFTGLITIPEPIITNFSILEITFLNISGTIVPTNKSSLAHCPLNEQQNLMVMNFGFETISPNCTELIKAMILSFYLQNLPSLSETTTTTTTTIISNTSINPLVSKLSLFQFDIHTFFQITPFILLLILLGTSLVFLNRQKESILLILRKCWEKGVITLVLLGHNITKPVIRRIVEEEELSYNKTRQKIINYLEFKKERGAYISEMRRKLELGTGQLLWHLEILQDFNIIRFSKVEGHKIYYLKEYPLNLDRVKVGIALKSPIARKIAKMLLVNGRMSVTEIAILSNCHRTTARNHLKKLEKLNVVKNKKIGRRIYFQVTNTCMIFDFFYRLGNQVKGA